MSFDYEEYEKECETIRTENEIYLDLFEKDLLASGLKEKTVRRHVRNAAFYINTFLLHEEPKPMKEGTEYAGSFLGYFFIRKCLWSTPASIRSTATSLKKFYRCMLEHGYIDQQSYDDMCYNIKENMEDWQADCAMYNDPDAANPFLMF